MCLPPPPFPRQFEYRGLDTVYGTAENAFEKTTTRNVASEPKRVEFVDLYGCAGGCYRALWDEEDDLWKSHVIFSGKC